MLFWTFQWGFVFLVWDPSVGGGGNLHACEKHGQVAWFFSASVSLFIICKRSFLKSFQPIKKFQPTASTTILWLTLVNVHMSDPWFLPSSKRKYRKNISSCQWLATATSPVLFYTRLPFYLIFKKFLLTKLCKMNIIMLILQTRHPRLPQPALHVHKLIKKIKEKPVRNTLLSL